MDWIKLTQGRDQCRIVVNMVMYVWGSIKGGEFLDQLDYY
jgi:hypothetical protein